mgnify:CR=1 FL=1
MKLRDLFKFDTQERLPRCSAVIVAAGYSQRMGSDKLMMELDGVPVLLRTLRAFDASPLVDEIVIVTRMEKIEEVAELCKNGGITKVSQVVTGGKTREESALAGVSNVRSDAKLIAIHDGARPLVTSDVILRTIYAAEEYLAAVPVISSADTLKQVDDKSNIAYTVDREHTLRVQTPQVFQADLVKGALTYAVEHELSLTDDCAAVERMGVKVRAVQGDEDNIKITTPLDIKLAEAILKARETGV